MTHSDKNAQSERAGRYIRRSITFVVVLAVAGMLVGVAATVNPYGLIDEDDINVPVVNTEQIHEQSAYTVAREFVGIVEARRESQTGFEISGEIVELLVDEGDFVDAGQILARLNTQLLRSRRDTLLAARGEARVRLELAELTRSRTLDARSLNAVSEQEWDEADKNRDAAAAALERANADIDAIDTRIGRAELRAPFAAFVSMRHLDEGRVAAAGEPVYELLESTSPEVRIGVSGDAIDVLSVGQNHDLMVRGRTVPATIRSVLPVRGNGTRSVDVIFFLHTEFNGIRRGDLAKLSINREVQSPGMWLPVSALTASSRGLWAAYTATPLPEEEHVGDATHKLDRRQIEVIHVEADRVYVRGTIPHRSTVVVEGLQRLVPDQLVRLAGEHATQIDGGAP